ncbi:MAG: ferritin-like domain-containing protein, partial [Pseudolabrys sp.]
IRTLGVKAPTSVISLARMSSVENPPAAGCEAMVKALVVANEVVIGSLSKAFATANSAREVGLSNFLQDRLDRHAKWHWMLTATCEED